MGVHHWDGLLGSTSNPMSIRGANFSLLGAFHLTTLALRAYVFSPQIARDHRWLPDIANLQYFRPCSHPGAPLLATAASSDCTTGTGQESDPMMTSLHALESGQFGTYLSPAIEIHLFASFCYEIG
jgi:hypothetical protein